MRRAADGSNHQTVRVNQRVVCTHGLRPYRQAEGNSVSTRPKLPPPPLRRSVVPLPRGLDSRISTGLDQVQLPSSQTKLSQRSTLQLENRLDVHALSQSEDKASPQPSELRFDLMRGGEPAIRMRSPPLAERLRCRSRARETTLRQPCQPPAPTIAPS
jgi:hypothetical protein